MTSSSSLEVGSGRWYLHNFEELLDGFGVIGKLLHQMLLHLRFAREHGVLAQLLAQADLDGVEVLVQLVELQLALGDLVEGDSHQAVLVKLPDVVEAWGREEQGAVPSGRRHD